MSALMRSMSDVDPSPFLAPISIYQPNNYSAQSSHAQNLIDGQLSTSSNINNNSSSQFNFSQSDLEESTFLYPNNLYSQLAVPALDRNETTNSFGLLFPSLNRGETEEMGAIFRQEDFNNNSNNSTAGIPPPFPPSRGFTELSLTFDEFGQAIAVNPPQTITNNNNNININNNNSNNASRSSPMPNQAFQTQFYDAQSPLPQQSSGQPIINQRVSQQPIINNNNNNYVMMQSAQNSVNNISSQNENSRSHKRIRADLPDQATNVAVPYISNAHAVTATPYVNDPRAVYNQQQIASIRAMQAQQQRIIPSPSMAVASPIMSASNNSAITPSRVYTAPSAAAATALPASHPSIVPRTQSLEGVKNNSNEYSTASVIDTSDTLSVSPSNSGDALTDDREIAKKVKHQMTDRQRRAKIKESMDQLKALVPLESNQKADQATIVAESVDLIKGMKDEIAALRAKVANLELTATIKEEHNDLINNNNGELSSASKDLIMNNNANKKYSLHSSYASSSPFSTMTASLNGAGVSMTRCSLDGRILEVNLVFEMVTGFNGNDLINRTPCDAPLFGHLSVIPKQFLKYFNSVSFTAQSNNANGNNEKENVDGVNNGSGAASPTASPLSSAPSSPSDFHGDGFSYPSPSSNSSINSSSSPSSSPFPSAAAASPLFSNVTISSLPIVPHNQLQSFFPFKCKNLPDPTASPDSSSMTMGPHAQFLINHLSTLPPNHVLKLLSRMSTSYGDTLESIQTMTLIRTTTGQPHYILSLTTPDGRRLVKPTKFLSSQNPNFTGNNNNGQNIKSATAGWEQ